MAFDAVVATALVWLAWRALRATDHFESVVLFIAFGLLLALSWARLQAPDLALAEAAIGSGLTGALLLSTLGRLRRVGPARGRDALPRGDPTHRPTGRVVQGLVTVALAATLWWLVRAVTAFEAATAGLAPEVQANMAVSGVSHPVTAVLLNFRAYDTLLEIGVLLAAIVAAWAVSGPPPPPDPLTSATGCGASTASVLTTLAALVVPLLVVAAGYLLWLGATAPGGAFQAGALLGGAGVLVTLVRPGLPPAAAAWLRRLLVLGLAVFLLTGVVVTLSGGHFLEYPQGWAGVLILLIESAATLSIGVTLALLFRGRPPGARV